MGRSGRQSGAVSFKLRRDSRISETAWARSSGAAHANSSDPILWRVDIGLEDIPASGVSPVPTPPGHDALKIPSVR